MEVDNLHEAAAQGAHYIHRNATRGVCWRMVYWLDMGEITMKLEHEVMLYLCPPVGGLSIVDHVLGAGDPSRLVKWLRATVERKEGQGEEIPQEIVNWIDAIDNVGSVLRNERVRESLCEWRNRMTRVNRHAQDELSVLTDDEWAQVGTWLTTVSELEA